jgi:hypothetical protein
VDRFVDHQHILQPPDRFEVRRQADCWKIWDKEGDTIVPVIQGQGDAILRGEAQLICDWLNRTCCDFASNAA